MKKTLIISLIALIILSLTLNSAASAAELTHEFEFSPGTIVGQTEYEIEGFNYGYGFFRSLLEFPLNVEIINLTYKNNYRSQALNIGGIEVSYSRNIDDDAGSFKDSDWLALSGIKVKDIYGETATRADKIEKIDFRIHSGWQPTSYNYNYTLYVGFKRDDYQLTAHDGRQIELTDTEYTTAGNEIQLDGDVLRYEAFYNMPYIGAGLKSSGSSRINLRANLFYSPWVKMEDKDWHLERDLYLEGEGNGNAVLADLNLSYDLDSSKDVFLNIKYNNTEVEGSQTQYSTEGTAAGVKYSARQQYSQYELGMGIDF